MLPMDSQGANSLWVVRSLLITYFDVELLKKEDPSDEPGLGILLSEEVAYSCMVCVYRHFASEQVCMEFVEGEDYC